MVHNHVLFCSYAIPNLTQFISFVPELSYKPVGVGAQGGSDKTPHLLATYLLDIQVWQLTTISSQK